MRFKLLLPHVLFAVVALVFITPGSERLHAQTTSAETEQADEPAGPVESPAEKTKLSATSELSSQVVEIQVRGNGKVESDAILTLLKTRAGERLNSTYVKEDIKSLFELGYFSDVRFLKMTVPGGINVIIQVVEKPAIVGIKFEGMNEITEDTVKEKLETKLYTIVNEATITADVRMIEKQYTEKGFYLARVHYNLEKKSATEVELTYVVEEGGKLKVGNVDILGNAYFSDGDIVDKLACRPYTRGSAFGSSSLFQDDLLRK